MIRINDFFYTEAQAAATLNVTRVTMWRWVKQKKFDIQRVGREILIPKWQVELLKNVSKRHVDI